MNTHLTEHFTLEEMTRSETARLRHIENKPNAQQVANLKNLCEQVLEPLRAGINAGSGGTGPALPVSGLADKTGSTGPVPPLPAIPIQISSGFRCPELNRLVGGARNSQHTRGEAADLVIENAKQGLEWILWIEENVDFDQVFLEKNAKGHYWVHVSCKADLRKNRHQVLKMQIKFS